ncbi:putative HTH-type transcriptional regulator [Ephemeroptericola cinctiostellae]|uniref:Putative HTH-type transcriptional regulator n=1 Tax=Ephemeroptericola cinctiostellae TaxID=2268024 RepID=A0A345DCP6_9BURK|nr:MarR family transcriptional regulator [Ephemeroptericola cinctiostellae]AXF86134.1 putative HTH-type transcriptional regulator [Ephemeroptericola cinctiostellae]
MTQQPFKNDADASTGFLLWQVHAIWQRQITAALRPHELTQVQFALLASLLWLMQREENITQIRLARHAKLDVMMTSQVLRALQARGLLERREHPTDTRAKVVGLTEAGIAKAMAVIPVVEQIDAQFFSIVGEQQTQLNGFLNLLIQQEG